MPRTQPVVQPNTLDSVARVRVVARKLTHQWNEMPSFTGS